MADSTITRHERLLIANAEIDGVAPLDIRCRDGRIVDIDRALATEDEFRLDAEGGAVVPGLNDHHIHLFALAAASRSVRCGPPSVRNAGELQDVLGEAPGTGWIRGVDYHESVAGILTRDVLDRLGGDRPIRIQHRSGKMWFLNSAAERELGLTVPDGQLFRGDALLRERLAADADFRSNVEATSRRLAAYGVTGITDATPTNDTATARLYEDLDLCQRVNLMGNGSLATGSLKIMLDDADLPELDALVARIGNAHERDRPVAFHCVTRTELVFALSALRDAGTVPGDRIEHASVTDAATMALFRDTPRKPNDLTVVTQPNFIAERGDAYVADVPASDHDNLYRCRGFIDAGIPLGGGTDAPFGEPDPWAAMSAAVNRTTADGRVLGAAERLTPERALALFTTPLADPGGKPRRIVVGAPAALCVLRRPWVEARLSLDRSDVRASVSGSLLSTPPATQARAFLTLGATLGVPLEAK